MLVNTYGMDQPFPIEILNNTGIDESGCSVVYYPVARHMEFIESAEGFEPGSIRGSGCRANQQ